MITTIEDDFQKTLDADPTDWQIRAMFADWLQDRDDPRAEGIRAIAALKVRPCNGKEAIFTLSDREGVSISEDDTEAANEILKMYAGRWWWCDSEQKMFEPYRLPMVWTEALPKNGDLGKAWTSRREAESVAAKAWLTLPADVRKDILEGVT